MPQHTSDESILAKIQGLVHEEQHLYGQNDLADYEIIEVVPSMADERLSFLIEK